MYSLPCPSCQAPVDVGPSQAGDQIVCPSCQDTIQVPKLGDLRQLPQTSSDNAGPTTSPGERAVGQQIGFVTLGLISLASLVIAAYCGIRWGLLEAPTTTEAHLQEIREAYSTLEPARLVREYEDMEKFGLAIAVPYTYKTKQNIRNRWGRNALIAGGICLACGITAVFLAGSGASTRADT